MPNAFRKRLAGDQVATPSILTPMLVVDVSFAAAHLLAILLTPPHSPSFGNERNACLCTVNNPEH